MDTAGAPEKHFQQSTEPGRVTSQKTSLETRSMFHSMSTTSQKVQCLNIKGPSTHSAQIPPQTAIWNSRYHVGCLFISVQLVISDTPYARSDLCSRLL